VRRVRKSQVIPAQLGAIALLLLALIPARAHPLSQGQVRVVIDGTTIKLTITIAAEEVIVEQAIKSGYDDSFLITSDAYNRHGEYLLNHFFVSADGSRLVGKITSLVEPVERSIHVLNIAGASASYEIEFPCSAPPTRIDLSENVLNEKEYEPGNLWEVSYIVSAQSHGKTLFENRLLSRTIPLDISFRESQVVQSFSVQKTVVDVTNIPENNVITVNSKSTHPGIVIAIWVFALLLIVYARVKRKS